jgi:peptidoglycan/LPS O-acetylase OafA/YrhL
VIAFSMMTAALTVIAALLSWNLLEKHFLRLKHLFPRAADGPLNAVEPLAGVSHITY